MQQIHLKLLNIRRWLDSLEDYVDMTSIREVLNDIKGYAIYKRKQVKRMLSVWHVILQSVGILALMRH